MYVISLKAPANSEKLKNKIKIKFNTVCEVA